MHSHRTPNYESKQDIRYEKTGMIAGKMKSVPKKRNMVHKCTKKCNMAHFMVHFLTYFQREKPSICVTNGEKPFSNNQKKRMFFALVYTRT